VKFPTGGKKADNMAFKPASAFGLDYGLGSKGQQIRCKSEADGDSPDERERKGKAPSLPLWRGLADVSPSPWFWF